MPRPGVGTFTHLGAELFKLTAGVDLLHVPFRGGGPAVIDVVGGHTKINFANLLTAMPHIRSGKLRALGVGGKPRTAMLPDVPTHRRSRRAQLRSDQLVGHPAPAGTPAAIVERLHQEIAAIQGAPEVQKQLAAEGAEVVRMSSAEFGAFLESEMNKWGRVIKEGNIKAQ